MGDAWELIMNELYLMNNVERARVLHQHLIALWREVHAGIDTPEPAWMSWHFFVPEEDEWNREENEEDEEEQEEEEEEQEVSPLKRARMFG